MPNLLLDALGDTVQEQIRKESRRMTMPKRHQLQYPNAPIPYVYFPLSGLASVVAVNDTETQVEVGIVGCEGMTGISVVHGVDRSPYSVFIQVAGEAIQVPSALIASILEKNAQARTILLRFAHLFLVQTSQTAIANAKATLQQRLARWLLMTQDRLDSPDIPLTHEFLAIMIAAHRPSLTQALQALAERGVLEPRRGSILILSRKNLEEHAGRFYGVTENEHKRLIQQYRL